MHQFVIKKVSWRKTAQTYGHCRKCRTHKPCQQRHRCLSPCLPWTWRPFCTQIFRLCVLVSCLCWLSSRIARWFPVSQRHRRHLSMRDRDRPMRRPVNTKGVMEEKRPHVRSRGDRTTNCLDRGPSQRRHVVSVRVWCRHGAPCGGRCGQDIEMPGPALSVPRTSLRQTVSRQNSSPEWMDEDDLLEDESDDGPLQERFSLAGAHLRPLQPTSYNSGKLDEHTLSIMESA